MANYVIVGGTSGIGLSLVEELDSDKSNSIYVVSRTNKNLDKLTNCIHIKWDAMELSNFESQLPEIVDGFVYCPGSVNLKPFARLTEKEFKDDFQLNFFGAVNSLHQVLPKLKMSPFASIVFLTTVAATIGMPFHTSIAASKGALEGFSKSLAAELAPAIRVNTVAPSLVKTPLTERLTSTIEKIEVMSKKHPLQKIGEPNDIANIITYLLSKKSKWITGQTFAVDGGMSTLKI
ncbi:MAG: SDR family oxidoreductase [Bacteroidetes bacterium]|nr:SDR family oxidoreductase [Bacteroidota bacterium]